MIEGIKLFDLNMDSHTHFKIIEKYFEEKKIADFQIASYNHLHHDLKKLIDDEPPLVIRDSKQNIKYKIKFDNVHITKPTFIDKNRKKVFYILMKLNA